MLILIFAAVHHTRSRFAQEARAAALNHPNICAIAVSQHAFLSTIIFKVQDVYLSIGLAHAQVCTNVVFRRLDNFRNECCETFLRNDGALALLRFAFSGYLLRQHW